MNGGHFASAQPAAFKTVCPFYSFRCFEALVVHFSNVPCPPCGNSIFAEFEFRSRSGTALFFRLQRGCVPGNAWTSQRRGQKKRSAVTNKSPQMSINRENNGRIPCLYRNVNSRGTHLHTSGSSKRPYMVHMDLVHILEKGRIFLHPHTGVHIPSIRVQRAPRCVFPF